MLRYPAGQELASNIAYGVHERPFEARAVFLTDTADRDERGLCHGGFRHDCLTLDALEDDRHRDAIEHHPKERGETGGNRNDKEHAQLI